jgi:SAM-dependent methyltransferase
MSRPPGFWDERYSEKGYAYGTEPNDFVRDHAAAIPHGGRVLCIGEGQGRNAVFLAQRGFVVTAMDQSPIGLNGAKALSREKGVQIETIAADLEDFTIAPAAWQAIVSVFVHLPPALRRTVHTRVVAGLAPGGALLFEAYAPKQLEHTTGGPEDAERMPGLDVLKEELAGLDFEIAREVERVVQEGRYHTGRAATVQILGRKPAA